MEIHPTVFVASSNEQYKLAATVHRLLEATSNAEVTTWKHDVVKPSGTVLDDLLQALDHFDFGVFVFAPDDTVAVRDAVRLAVRDNVLFELGLFCGRLGRRRSFVLVPRGLDRLHVASDLQGLTLLEFDPARSDGNIKAALGTACDQILDTIKAEGPRRDRVARLRAAAVLDQGTMLPAEQQILFRTEVGGASFVVIHDDICSATTDVVVSSDDNHFTARGGVSRSILAKAGLAVREQLNQFARLAFRQGHLAVTTAGDWQRRAIVHAAVIDLEHQRYPTQDSIRTVTRRVLACSTALGAQTVALPILGGGYATQHLNALEMATAVASEVLAYLALPVDGSELKHVALYVYERADAQGLAALLPVLQSGAPAASSRH